MAMGSILALTGTFLRAGTMRESPAWLEARTSAKHSRVFSSFTSLRAIGKPLLGTTSIYFLYDVVAWGVGSYTTEIFKSDDRKTTLWYLVLLYTMAAPGYFLTLCMGRFGRRTFQLAGFLVCACCYFAVGASFGNAPQFLVVFIYGVQKIFDACGPGATTFIIPGEIFPSAVRATCHGTSCAAGKLGAFVGIYLFPFVKAAIGNQGTFFVGGTILSAGSVLTCLLTPPYNEETLQRLRAKTQKDISCTTRVLWGKDLVPGAGNVSLSLTESHDPTMHTV